MSLDTVTIPLRTLSPHFQRSINLTYDVGNADYVAGYIPIPNGAAALSAIFDGTMPNRHQRAHVLHAAYGSGKSLLGLVLSTLASQDTHCHEAISIVLERLTLTYSKQVKVFKTILVAILVYCL